MMKQIYIKSGSDGSNEHHILDRKLNKFMKIHQFDFAELTNHGLIYLPSTKTILLFGGSHGFHANFSDSVFSFSTSLRIWKKLDIKMPVKQASFGLVKTRTDRYVIIFGGEKKVHSYIDNIFVYDTRLETFKKSEIKCPQKDGYYAALTNETNDRDELATFGCIKRCYKQFNFAHIQILPIYLIDLICQWVVNQDIYLLQRGNGNLWRMTVDDILTSLC